MPVMIFSAVPVFVTANQAPLLIDNSSIPASFSGSKSYLCQKLSFSRVVFAGMLMGSLTKLSVFFAKGPEANHDVEGVWLLFVTSAQFEVPVLALALQPGAVGSKF